MLLISVWSKWFIHCVHHKCFSFRSFHFNANIHGWTICRMLYVCRGTIIDIVDCCNDIAWTVKRPFIHSMRVHLNWEIDKLFLMFWSFGQIHLKSVSVRTYVWYNFSSFRNSFRFASFLHSTSLAWLTFTCCVDEWVFD